MITIDPPVARPRLFGFSVAFERGWAGFTVHYGPLLLAGLLYFALSIAIAIVQNVLDKLVGFAGLFGLPLGLLVTAPLNAGFVYFTVRRVRGERVPVERMFDSFGRYWPVVGTQALLLVVTVVCVVPVLIGAMLAGVFSVSGSIGVGAAAPLLVGAAFTVVLSLVLGIRFAFAQVVILDQSEPRPGPVEAMRLSWAITASPNWLPLIGLAFVLGLIAVITFAACLLPLLFFGLPLVSAVWAEAYNQMSAELGIGPVDPLPPADG